MHSLKSFQHLLKIISIKVFQILKDKILNSEYKLKGKSIYQIALLHLLRIKYLTTFLIKEINENIKIDLKNKYNI
jgi:hypothetical protein